MHKILYPSKIVDSIYYIALDELYKNNIRGLILDIDNTLVGHGIREADDRVVEWIENAKKIGMKVCIVSNNTEDRVVKFNERLKVHAIHRAAKPRRRAFLKAAELMNVSPKEIAVIGDQIFTDIFGGNRLGMLTILVKPVHHVEPYTIKFKRILEKLVLSRYMQN